LGGEGIPLILPKAEKERKETRIPGRAGNC